MDPIAEGSKPAGLGPLQYKILKVIDCKQGAIRAVRFNGMLKECILLSYFCYAFFMLLKRK